MSCKLSAISYQPENSKTQLILLSASLRALEEEEVRMLVPIAGKRRHRRLKLEKRNPAINGRAK
jgi:hypothetical protein